MHDTSFVDLDLILGSQAQNSCISHFIDLDLISGSKAQNQKVVLLNSFSSVQMKIECSDYTNEQDHTSTYIWHVSMPFVGDNWCDPTCFCGHHLSQTVICSYRFLQPWSILHIFSYGRVKLQLKSICVLWMEPFALHVMWTSIYNYQPLLDFLIQLYSCTSGAFSCTSLCPHVFVFIRYKSVSWYTSWLLDWNCKLCVMCK